MTSQVTFQDQVQRYAEGRATADEVAQLCAELRENAASRREFLSLMNLESALEAIAAEWVAAHPRPLPLTSVAEPQLTAPPSRRVPIRKGYLAALAVCLVALVCYQWQEFSQNRVFAVVKKGTGVPELPGGTELRNEWIQIAGGTVELMTPDAARIVIEAPATFRFDSPLSLSLMRGRLAADIPPAARKFTVVTPSGEAVDLGTKFGVDVPLRAEAEIHVFQGEVIAQSSHGGLRKNLHTGEAFQLKSGAGASRMLRSAAFIRPEEVGPLHAALWAGQPQLAADELEQLRRELSLVSLLDFETSEQPAGQFDFVQGRWPGSRSAEFVKPEDSLQVSLPKTGKWTQLTLATWVRLNHSEKISQSLLSTTTANGSLSKGLQWRITSQQVPQLLVDGTTYAPQPAEQAASLPLDQDRWAHLAVVFDAVRGHVQFFVNGELYGTAHLAAQTAVLAKSLVLGRSAVEGSRLSGRVDEFVFLGRSMSPAEVREVYSAGNPYR